MRIAVIGGGLGGIPVGILLQRAGHDVTVYEQASKLERIGAGIHLFPNAGKVLQELGLFDRLANVGLVPDRMWHREWDTGKVTFEVRMDRFPKLFGVPHLIIHRGDLVEILASGLETGSFVFGKRLIGFEDDGRMVSLSFSDGSNSEAEIVIGADGINSVIRATLLGPEQPTYTGHVAHRAIFPIERLGDLKIADATKWWADDRYFLAYFPNAAKDEIYFVTGVPEIWRNDNFAPIETNIDTLLDAFQGFHPEVQEIVKAAIGCMTWPVLYRDPNPLWSQGRVVVLGDACHPMKPHMGQGAAMAMEDAVVLARCIGHYPEEHIASAFALYQSTRYDRTKRIKLESDKHEWMRHGSEADWVFGYEAAKAPLRDSSEI